MLANFMAWMDKRLPLTDAWNKHLAQYPAPKKTLTFGTFFWLVSHVSTGKPNFNWCVVNHEL